MPATRGDGYNYDRVDPAYYTLGDYRGPRVGDPFPPFTLSTIGSRSRSLGDYAGRTPRAADGVVDPWTARLDPCADERAR